MAGGEEQNRSEQPTSFKLARARDRGNVARGSDLGYLTGLAAFAAICWISGPAMVASLSEYVRETLIGSAQLAEGNGALLTLVGRLLSSAVAPLLLIGGTIFCTVLLFELIQTGPIFSFRPLKPDFSRINPATGIKRLFSVRLLIETAKNVLKLGVYSYASWIIVKGAFAARTSSITDARSLIDAMASVGFRLLATFVLIALFFAAIDQVIARRDFIKGMRMSRREVKREYRDREGEPRLKQKRKSMHAEFIKNSQSLRGVRTADVLITNPEHIALALRYDRATMPAPVIVSIGTNHFAQRLKRLAFLYGVVIVENRELARQLLPFAALNAAIPEGFYRPVADIYNRPELTKRRSLRQREVRYV